MNCEICGQDNLVDEGELRSHVQAAHVSGWAAQCPFCDLAGVTAAEMAAHVAAAHAEKEEGEGEPSTPDVDGFLELGDESSDIGKEMRWLEERAREGPADEREERGAPPTTAAVESSNASPMSTGTDFSSSVGGSTATIQALEVGDEAQGSPLRRSQGAIQKRPRVVTASSPQKAAKRSHSSPRDRPNMTLDVKPRNLAAVIDNDDDAPSTSFTLTCPMCPHRENDPAKMEEHLNRKHFDLTSPPGEWASSSRGACSSSSFSCPICSRLFSDPAQLQRHVNHDHSDILSPGRPKSSGGKGEEEEEDRCPVCFKAGFTNRNLLARHVDSHFSAAANDDEEDSLLAQELDRREREQRRFCERRELEQLRAQYGMDEDGNYERQEEGALVAAARRGRISAVDYHERRIESKRSRSTGMDDLRTVTRDALSSFLRAASASSPGVARSLLASSPVDHCAAGDGDRGWGCGYRNLQMLLSCLAAHPPYRDRLQGAGILTSAAAGVDDPNNANSAPGGGGGRAPLPSIPRLQTLIEGAWNAGYDVAGGEQLGGRLSGTRKWIGATEIAALLRHAGIRAEVRDFHRPTAADGTHPALFAWVVDYFSSRARSGAVAPPLYLQHQGHSRTVVGAEVTARKGSPDRLLVFDPSHPKSRMSGVDPGRMLHGLRRNLSAVKSRQYQIVSVSGVYDTEAEAQQHKVIHPVRIP